MLFFETANFLQTFFQKKSFLLFQRTFHPLLQGFGAKSSANIQLICESRNSLTTFFHLTHHFFSIYSFFPPIPIFIYIYKYLSLRKIFTHSDGFIQLFGSLIENMRHKFGNYPLSRYLCIQKFRSEITIKL